MKLITIVIPEGENNLSSITGTYEILTRANKYWKQNGKKELYKIELAGVSEKVEYCRLVYYKAAHQHFGHRKNQPHHHSITEP